METTTTVTAIFSSRSRSCRTAPIYQYDIGDVLTITGIDLHAAAQVHFSNTENGESKTSIMQDGQVTIPQEYTQSGEPVYAWLYLADEESGSTKLTIVIPVIPRGGITDQQPDPDEQSTIDQTIAALNRAVEQTAQDVADAQTAATAAQTAQTAAEAAQTAAETAAQQAAAVQTDVDAARDAAIAAKTAAETAQTQAGQSAQSATDSATAAAQSAQTASEERFDAETAAQQASASATAAQTAQTGAESAAADAAHERESAMLAAGAAGSAMLNAQTAQTAAETAATNAQQSATAAAQSVTAANTAKTDAQTAKSSAEAARTGAETAQAAAEAALANYDEMEQSVSELRSAFSSDLVSIHPTWVQGKYIEPGTGNAGTSSSFYATEYLDVEPNATMVFYAAMASTAALAFYDENKYYVSGYVDDDLYVQRSVKIPANAHYVRYSCRADYHDSSARQEQIGTVYFTNQVDAVRESLPDMNGYLLDMAKKANAVISWNAVSATGIGGLVDIGNTVRTGSGYAASCPVSEGELCRISGRQFSSYPTDSMASFASAYLLRSSGSIVKIGWVAEAGYFSNLEILIPSGVDELVVNLNSSAGLSDAIKKANILTPGNVSTKLTQAENQIAVLTESTESYPNIANVNNVVIGRNWLWGIATNRAVLNIPVNGGFKYSVYVPSSSKITKITFVEKAIETGNSLKSTGVNAGGTATITTNTDAKILCAQFEAASDIVAADFDDYNLIVKYGDSTATTDIDAYARGIADNQFGTFHDMVLANREGENRIGGYIVRNTAKNPHILMHSQEAWGTALYYDVNTSAEQYEVINNQNIVMATNILNNLPQEEIDFTPSDDGFTRIIMGKNTDDEFFVSYVASSRTGQFGLAEHDAVEITSDFRTFRTIIKGDGQPGDGIEVTGKTFLKAQTIKQFADGSYLVPLRCHDISTNTDGIYFYKLSADMETLTPCVYTNLSGNTVEMKDEFNGQLYDWHVCIIGAKAIVTTYGSRQPESDYGRVWYSEDNGNTWKQVFQMTNHYQDGVAEGTTITQTHMHGVFLDPYSDRMYIVAGEDNRNIFWSNKGINTTDNDWNVIPIREQSFYQVRGYSQVVGGYAFKDALVFGSDNAGLGTIDRLNKLDGGEYSMLEPAYEFLPNVFKGTNYCQAEIFRRDAQTPLLFCMTHENAGETEADNEHLNRTHKGRVVASYDGLKWTEVWSDDTYGSHPVNIDGTNTTRNYSYCTRGMNCYLLKNGDAVIKYSGRDFYYFGGVPLYSVTGYSNGSCKVRYIHGAEKYLK